MTRWCAGSEGGERPSQQRRTIVFVDESGLSTHPTRVRTWAPRGQTPVLHETFNWKSLSIIGGLALWRFYFQIHAGSIKSPQVVEFLQHLQRHVGGKMLILWDGAPIHRSLLVKNYVATPLTESRYRQCVLAPAPQPCVKVSRNYFLPDKSAVRLAWPSCSTTG